jgi:hypothetical protein
MAITDVATTSKGEGVLYQSPSEDQHYGKKQAQAVIDAE